MQQGKRKKIVVIGGGTGLATILRGLKTVNIEITAIVTVADDGGSSGILREEMNMPPPGDVRNVLVALADKEPLLQSLFQHRFRNGNGLAGHSLGNLLIAGMQEITGDFVTAVKALSRVLAVRGNVLPAANSSIRLVAEMADGSIVVGESNIPKVNKKIHKVMLEPADIEALPEAVQAIEEADMILVGPGSLYTSIIPNLLVQEIQQALRDSQAQKIYVSNVMTQPGETDGYTVRDHIQAIYEHIQFPLFQKAIVNNGEIPLNILKKYERKSAVPVRYHAGSLEDLEIEVIEDQLFLADDYLRHDAGKVTQIVLQCINGMD
ncbi:gluconeogenesis factor YvcK family protein [Caldalkalibacillus mannanilyticus]|uniref:gluconeogenesis factor YvcK family protein n=1 Tax=Caldalkalibacillus mannanilyticus TaxID=1418 RepID=UPI000ADFE2CE|nr:YvcK family protein [Caldalkalibacillus mannanilyticus]